VQMEREVAALRQQTGVASARDLDAVLGALASALPPGRVPAALQYSGSELRAGGLALSPDEFRAVAAQLKALGYGASAEGSTIVVAAEDAR
jgi:general secretion pathway protein L